MKLILMCIILLIIRLYLNPKIDFVDNNLIIIWYGYKNRKYIKLFRI